MGTYTDYFIKATVLPQYKGAIEHFIKHGTWPKPRPPFIEKWVKYLVAVGQTQTYYVDADKYHEYAEYNDGNLYKEADDDNGDNDGAKKVVKVYFCPPLACEGEWGFINKLEGDTWVLAGSMKNYHDEIQAFLIDCLIHTTSCITQCWSLHEYSMDSYLERKMYDDRITLDDVVRKYTDEEIRKSRCKLFF